MKIAAIAGVLISFATAAQAADIDIGIERFIQRNGISKAILKVTNHLPNKVTGVYIECAFLDSDRRAIDIGNSLINSIDANSYAYDSASIVAGEGAVKFADCRVIRTR